MPRTSKSAATAVKSANPKTQKTRTATKPTAKTVAVSAAQKKIDDLAERIKIEGFVIAKTEGGKFSIKKKGGRKAIEDGLTIAGVEAWVVGYFAKDKETPEQAATEQEAIALEEDEAIEDHEWEETKSGNLKVYLLQYQGQFLKLVEANYDPDLWAVYLGKVLKANAVKGLDNAKKAAIDAADREHSQQFVEATVDAQSHFVIAAATTAEDEEEQEFLANLPSRNPNTKPELAAALKAVFDFPAEGEFIGTAATPTEEINKQLSKLAEKQSKGELTVADVCKVIGVNETSNRLEIALKLAINGIEILFLSDNRVELTTAAPEVIPF